jgi:hypothetical protein
LEEYEMNKFLVPVLAIVLLAGSLAFAAQTFQEWRFNNDTVTPAPDTVNNPYGTPALRVAPGPGGWISGQDGRTGIWSLSGEIDIIIPNRPVIEGWKVIDLYVVWKAGNLDPFLPDVPLVGVQTNPEYEKLEMSQERTVLQGPGDWRQTWYAITVWPNPDTEWLAIKGDILVDEVRVTTECVPEPATVGLLAGSDNTCPEVLVDQ